jgi:MFS transporter, ACS family, hexuronate transporter
LSKVRPESDKQGHSLDLIPAEPYRWFAVLVMWKAHLIYFLIYSSVGILGPILKGELKLNNTEFGILCGAIGVGTTAAQIPAGLWCDRLGVRKVMTLAFLLMGGCAFGFSVSEGLLLSCAILFCLGIGVGCSQIGAAKAILDWFPCTGRATAMGMKQTGINAGGIAGSLLLPLLLGFCDWRLLFRLMGALAFVFALFFSFFYRDARNIKTDVLNPSVRFREAVLCFKDLRFVSVTTAGVFLMIAQFSFSSYLVLYLTQSLHYSLETAGVILASSFAVGAFARVGWGFVSDYFSCTREASLIFIGGLGVVVTVTAALLNPASPVWVLYLLSFLSGVSLLGWNGVWITLAGEVSTRSTRGFSIGFSFFFANLGLLFGPPLFGFLTDLFGSFFFPWIFLALCMGMVSMVLLLARRPTSPKGLLYETGREAAI